MCSINLIIDKNRKLDKTPIRKMNQATLHRGPDQSQDVQVDFLKPTLFLGHNRLKIIDLESSIQQPLVSDCGRYYLLFNGEIYNYMDLKNLLIDQKINFKTHTDSEVLLHYLIHNGKEGIKDLNGMFAFIFIHLDEETILLTRDRFGMKPIYYFEDDDYLIVSSETKGILASELVTKDLNESQVPYYLRFRYTRAPETFFKNIFSIMPGEIIEIYKNTKNREQIETESPTQQSVFELSKNDLVKHVENLLLDSVVKHIHADVPVGLFLSGGVDSTTILALLQKASIPSIPSFSIISGKKERSFGTEDYKFARKAAKQYGSYHYELEIEEDLLDGFDHFIGHLDQAVGDSAAFLTFILSKEARKSVGVVLSGAGADEIFAGYNRHLAFYKYLQNPFLKNLVPYRRLLTSILPSGFDHPFRKKFQLMTKFLENLSDDPAQTYLNFTSLQNLKNSYPLHNHPEDLWLEESIEKNLSKALNYDQKNFLVNDVLQISDLMSMQHSLEMRMPYLDNDLVSFVRSILSTRLISKGRKWILNKILDDNHGNEFTKRNKEGFGLPFGSWIKNPSNVIIEYYLRPENLIIHQYLPYPEIQVLLNDHKANIRDNSLELWSILVLAAWLEKEFK